MLRQAVMAGCRVSSEWKCELDDVGSRTNLHLQLCMRRCVGKCVCRLWTSLSDHSRMIFTCLCMCHNMLALVWVQSPLCSCISLKCVHVPVHLHDYERVRVCFWLLLSVCASCMYVRVQHVCVCAVAVWLKARFKFIDFVL